MENNHVPDFETFETIDLKRFADALRRGTIWIVLGLILGLGAALLFSKLQTPIYAATTQVMVARSNAQSPVTDLTQQMNSQQIAQTYVELLLQDWVRKNVATRLGGPAITSDQIDVSAAANTQIIRISVEDANPQRAIAIADMLVTVLAEQNDSIQATRYNDTQTSLDLQIKELETKITAFQVELGKASTAALNTEIATAQKNINATQETILMGQAGLDRLESIEADMGGILALLQTQKAALTKNQATQTRQLAEQQALQDRIKDPIVSKDKAISAAFQTQIGALGARIDETGKLIDSLTEEIAWLTPLAEPGAFEKALSDQEQQLAFQRGLLVSYQDTYTKLLVSGKTDFTNDTISGLEKNLNLYQQIYLKALDNREAVRLARMQNVTNIVQLNPALADPAPVRPRVLLNTLLGALAGLLLSTSLILLLNSLDTTLKTREDVERILDMHILGYSLYVQDNAEDSGPHVVRFPRSPAAEAFRSLRTNLDFIAVDKPLKSVLISSPGASEGKTTVAINLAAIIAQSGKRVVLIDADLRRPRTHRALGLTNRTGLSDVFLDKISLQDAIRPVENLGFSIITSGGLPPNPAELLASAKMRQLLDQLESLFDFVVVDSTPTLVTDSQLIAARVDGVLLVLSPGTTHADAARTTVDQYRRVGANLLGVVMNNVQASQSYYSGYAPYSNYQYYQYSSADQKSASTPLKPGVAARFRPPWHTTQPRKSTSSDTAKTGK